MQKLDALVKPLAPLQAALQQSQATGETLTKNNAVLQGQLLQAQQKQQNLSNLTKVSRYKTTACPC